MSSPVIVVLDYSSETDALALAKQLDSSKCRVKVGKELFTSAGPDVVRELVAMGFEVFLDLKYHDIPNTVAGAVKAAAELGVWMVNVHASGGRRMMEAAAAAINECESKPLLIGVTVLTSMESAELQDVGVERDAAEQVKALALLAKESGLDGVVCSAEEANMLKQEVGKDFCLVTPGIRPAGSSADDQRRIVTPQQAIINGSDYLVIGRPITKAENPAQALDDILASLLP